jgi:hypothetical protein
MKTATLKSQTRQTELLPKVEVASRFLERGIGLLGRSKLGADEALWIHPCNNIHTFFMAFAIDCVFLDRELTVKRIVADVKPWRVIWPVWGASSVIEMSAGTASRLGLQVGERLHVGA